MSTTRSVGSVLTAAAAVISAVTMTLAAGIAPAAAQEIGRSFFVDCSAPSSGSGTHKQPWNSLDQTARHDFGPGDTLLFRRGSTCTGTLAPRGSGSPDRPFLISDYGSDPRRAKIDGAGAPAVIKIFNAEHIALTDLEITNAARPQSQRRGVLVQLEDFGRGTGYRLENLDIHDVLGGDLKGPDGSQGIAFVVSGSQTPTKFDSVRITGNRLDHIDRQGIVAVASSWSSRPEVEAGAPDSWLGSTRVTVNRNRLSDLGGDGIVMNTTEAARVQHNVVHGFNRRSAGYNAGIWPYNSDDALFEYNDVSGGHGHRDGMAYDVDQGNLGTTFRYNRSHHNDGGFFLLCNNGPGVIRDAVIHDNTSYDDSYRGIENCQGRIESATFERNRIVIGDGVSQTVVNENTTDLRNVDLKQNVVIKTGSGTADFNLRSGGYSFEDNVFVGVQRPPE